MLDVFRTADHAGHIFIPHRMCYAGRTLCTTDLQCRPTVNSTGAGRLGAAVWAPPFGRTGVWAPDLWAPAFMREEIRFYKHYHYLVNPA